MTNDPPDGLWIWVPLVFQPVALRGAAARSERKKRINRFRLRRKCVETSIDVVCRMTRALHCILNAWPKNPENGNNGCFIRCDSFTAWVRNVDFSVHHFQTSQHWTVPGGSASRLLRSSRRQSRPSNPECESHHQAANAGRKLMCRRRYGVPSP